MAAERAEGDRGGSLEEKGGGSLGEKVHGEDQSDHNEKNEDEDERVEERVKQRRASRGRKANVTPKQLFSRSGTFSPERVITFPMLLDYIKVRGPG